MKYNVLLGAEWDVNTTDGNVDLDYPDLYGLMDYGDEPITSLSGADVLVVDFDFGYRLHLDRFEYKYETPYATAVDVASGIEFYYKNESFDAYESLPTYVAEGDVYFTTISGGLYAPRYMRVKHEVANTQNATTISGAVYGFKAFNDDEVVDFGEDGTASSSHIEIVREATPDVRAIAIYNSGESLADAYVNIEPSHTGIDYALAISASEGGPWTYTFDSDSMVAGSSNFNYGLYEDLNVDTNVIRITGLDLYDGGYVTQHSYGIYTTKVFAQSDADYTRFVIDYSDSGGSMTTDIGDPVDTIEVRSSNTVPTTYLVVVEFYDYQDGVYHYYRYRDRWVPSEALKSVGTQNFFTDQRYARYKEHTIFMDQNNENYAGFVMYYNQSDSNANTRLYLFRNNLRSGAHEYKTMSRSDDYTIRVDYIPYDLKLDYESGMWVYFYCKTYESGTFVDTNGYYLVYFDSDLVDSFKYISTEEEIGTISNNYYTKELWYTKPSTIAIYLVTHEGTVTVNFSDEDLTYDLGGIACLSDGNLLYANDKNLHRLHKEGYPMSEYDIEDIASDKLVYIALDPTEDYAAWAIDGSSVGRFFYDGSRRGDWDFKVSVSLPIRFEVVDTGVWVKCSGPSGESGIVMRYISKENRRVDFEYESDADRSQPALHCQTYEHEYYTEKMPLASDNVWPLLSWQKINLQGYLANEDNFYQMRLTLRRQRPIDRYPDFVTDSTQDYISVDYFTKNSSTPEQLIWGDWLNKPALDRVYVSTSEDVLVLEPTGPTGEDAYISTQNRLVLGVDDSGKFEARIGYIVADGDGVATGQDENIYIYAYSVEDGFEGNYMAARLRLDDNINSSNSTLYCKGAFGWSSDNVVLSDSYYEGELALYWDAEDVHVSVRPNNTGSWTTYDIAAVPEDFGNYFYIKIVVPKESSRVKINYFTVPYGIAYPYTETLRVSSINKQNLVKIEDVYPNSYKNVYLRSYVSRDLDLGQSSEVDMKVRWRIPTY